MTESCLGDQKYMFTPEKDTIPNKLNEIVLTGIEPDKIYHLRNPVNTSFCRCGSLMNLKCGSEFPPDFFDLLDDKNKVMTVFTKKMWYSLRDMNREEQSSWTPPAEPTPEITGTLLKIPISNSENLELDLKTVNGDFKRGSIEIKDKQTELRFPTKTLTGKQVLCLVYNNKAEFMKTFSSKKRHLDIIVWYDRNKEWYIRLLMTEDNYIQICANKKMFLSPLKSTDSYETLEIRDPIWKDYNKSILINKISLEVMGKSININLTESNLAGATAARILKADNVTATTDATVAQAVAIDTNTNAFLANHKPTIYIKEINKSMKLLKDQDQDQDQEDFIEKLILGDETLDEMQLCELQISLVKYKLDEYVKTELSEVNESVFKKLTDEYQRLQNLYHKKFVVNKFRETQIKLVLFAMQFSDRYLLELKNGYKYIVDPLSEIETENLTNEEQEQYSVFFTIQAEQPKNIGCWINNSPTKRGFNIDDIYNIQEIPKKKGLY